MTGIGIPRPRHLVNASPAPVTYMVTFTHLGRSPQSGEKMNTAVIIDDGLTAQDTVDFLASELHRHVKPHLFSRDIDTHVHLSEDLMQGEAYIYAGGPQCVGTATLVRTGTPAPAREHTP